MSDIPDWLVELAAQRDLEEDAETDSAESVVFESSDSRPLDSESAIFDDVDTFPSFADDEDMGMEPEAEAFLDDAADAPEQDLMATLRSQVADGDEEEGVKIEERASRSFSLRIPGLLPWQQLVLTVLLFLDVVVIGLLILVMLGRIVIP